MESEKLQQARRWARRAFDLFPLTWRGFFVALFSGLALWRFGYGTLDLLLFVIGISGLVLIVLSVLAVCGCSVYLRRRIIGAPPPRRLEAGSRIATGFQVPALSWMPLVRLRWLWLEPLGVRCTTRLRGKLATEEVVAERRSLVSGVRRRITVEDAFGLSAVTWERSDAGPLTVLPDVGRLKNMPVLQPMASAEGLPHPMGSPEGDRMEIRRYVPGDSVRNIMWKTFARTRQLNVRTPEKSIDRARRTIAYLLTGPGDEPAAAAARVAIERDRLGVGWLFGADGTTEPAESLDSALEAIARSSSYRHNGGRNGSPAAGLSAFLSDQDAQGEVHCIVFAPARSGAWTDDALAVSRSFSGAVSFVLGTDGVAERRPSSLWHRLLFLEPPAEGISTEQLAELMATFSRAGCEVQVVDRSSGRTFDGRKLTDRVQMQTLGSVA
ncbi:MAG: DUF58 domain-containing protein [Acidobacteriota bacterium]